MNARSGREAVAMSAGCDKPCASRPSCRPIRALQLIGLGVLARSGNS